MGLDMYAYTIKKELVDDNEQTDTNVHKKARRAVGFLDLSSHDMEKLEPAGVSQYYGKSREATQRATEEGFFNPDFAYWRKFNNLHGWMANLYKEKGGTSDPFNCNTVRLDMDDLDRLEREANVEDMPPTSGFFFGSYDELTQEDIEEIKSFVKRAKEATNNGMVVYYDSWW